MADTVKIRNVCPAGITYDLEGVPAVAPGDVVEIPAGLAADYLTRDQWEPADDAARQVVKDLEELAAAATEPDPKPAAAHGRRSTRKDG